MKELVDYLKNLIIEKTKGISYPIYYLTRIARNAALLIMSVLTVIKGQPISTIFDYSGPLLSDMYGAFEENQIYMVTFIFATVWVLVLVLFFSFMEITDPDNTRSSEDNNKINVLLRNIQDVIKLATILYYCGYAANATLQLLKHGVLLNEQKMVGGISIVVFVSIVYKYFKGLNKESVRRNDITKSEFCDINGNTLCLGDKVGWCGRIYMVSLTSGEWCLERRQSDSNRLLDVKHLKDVVEKDSDHLILIK